jgi:hypothetical protein
MQYSLILLLRHRLMTMRVVSQRLAAADTMAVQPYQQLAKRLTSSQPSPGPRLQSVSRPRVYPWP